MTTKIAQPPKDCISRVRFGEPRLLIASSWDGHVRLYDVSSGQLIGIEKHSLAVLDCTFSQDCRLSFSGGLERQVFAFDFQSQKETLIGQHDDAIRCVEVHRPTQMVFSASWDRSARAWDPRGPKKKPVGIVNLGVKAFAMDVSSDKLLVGGSDRHIHIYDVRKLAEPLERRESSLKHQIRSLKVSADEKSFASGSVEGRVAIEYFNAEENSQLRYAFKCHRVRDPGGEETVHPVNALSFHPVHGTVATGGSDGGVCVWDSFAKKRLWKLNPFETSVSSLCFSSDGTQLAIAVSYTFDRGELVPPPPSILIRQITNSEVRPKPS